MLMGMSALLTACQLVDPASLDGLFAESRDSGLAPEGNPANLDDTNDGPGDPDSGVMEFDTGNLDTGAFEQAYIPCWEDPDDATTSWSEPNALDPRHAERGDVLVRLNLQDPTMHTQVPPDAAGIQGQDRYLSDGTEVMYEAVVPPLTRLSLGLRPMRVMEGGSGRHLVALLDGCPRDAALCEDYPSIGGTCLSEVLHGSWGTGDTEPGQAVVDNRSSSPRHITILVDQEQGSLIATADLVFHVTEL